MLPVTVVHNLTMFCENRWKTFTILFRDKQNQVKSVTSVTEVLTLTAATAVVTVVVFRACYKFIYLLAYLLNVKLTCVCQQGLLQYVGFFIKQ